jgi:aminopeptidase N
MQKVSRLIESFTPSTYQLSLTLERIERVFSGTVTIQGDTHQAGSFRLHAKELEINSITVNGKFAEYTTHDNDELEITADHILAGPQTVVIGFNGRITDHMHGLYPCYFEHDGVKKELLATQFESHHAREVFPCVDEPEAKATFDLTLTTETGITVLANMPIKAQREEDEKLITTFDTSPRMSSYLLAWVVGELHRKTAMTKSGVEVNVWATPNQPLESLDFALDIAVRSIDFFNKYFDVPYPLPKADNVALPDFSSGAMENWGLLTYREAALLADPKTTSISARHHIATVVAHELAHQWFGDLVTMKWWNDLWLNESFATLMEYIAIDAIEPDWNIWLDFSANESIAALRRDATSGVQSVQADVNHPDEINTLFDGAIVYAKGARLLRMLQEYIGTDAFRVGLSNYFKQHAYKNTEAKDLWDSLSKSSGKNINEFMSGWISQPGYPVVEFNNDSLTQSQFFIGEHSPSETLWQIPLGATNDSVTELMVDKTIQTTAPATTKLNTSGAAHFITSYSSDRLQAIIANLESSSPVERLQLIHEQSLLARAGLLSSAALIPLFKSYENESTECVWDILSLTFSELKKFVEDNEDAEQKLKDLSASLARKQYERLGWDEQSGEVETDTKLRTTILAMMLYSDNQEVIENALSRFDSSNIESIPSEYRYLILSTAVKHASTPELIDTLLGIYTTTSNTDLKQDIAAGATSTKDTAVAKRLLDLMKDGTVIKNQDAYRWFAYLMRGRYTRQTTWEWLRSNWQWVKDTFGGDKSYDDFIRYAGAGLMTRTQLQEFETFFTPKKSEPALTRAIELAIIEIEARIQLIDRDKEAVQAKLLAS